MTTNIYGAADRVAKAGDTMTGPLVLTGSPPVQIPAGATAGDVLASDASGNASWTPPNLDWINVKSHGAKGDGSTDDATALNSAIAGAPAGSTIYFPRGTYIVGSTIILFSDLRYVGSDVEQTVIKMRSGANLPAVATTPGWAANTATSSYDPLHLRNLTFDGNSSNQTSGTGHGVVLQTYYSNVEYCNFQNTRGDGIRLDSVGANGSTSITNNGVENRFHRLQCRNNGGNGINVNDPSRDKMTDGWITDCIVDTPGQNGILVMSSAGWTVMGCHVYNIPQSGIRMDRAFETRIMGNYIESCGSSTTSGFYFLIDCANGQVTDGGQGSVISGNTAYFQGPAGNAGSTIAGISVQSASGGSGNVSIAGNQLYCTGSSGLPAIQLQNQNSSASLTAKVSGNNLVGWTTNVQQVTNGGTLTASGDNIPAPLSSLSDYPATTDARYMTLSTYGNAFAPSDHGLIAWTMDPSTTSSSGTALSTGYIYLMMIVLRQATTISKINAVLGAAGSGLTSGQCLAGLYSTTGTRLAITADMSTTWNSVGNKTMSLTSSYSAAAGKYYVAMLVNGTTSPYFACGSTFGATFTPGNANLSAGAYRWCRSASGQTALPASITLSGYTPDANNIYAAVA